MDARIPLLSDLPSPLRLYVRIAAEFLVMGTPLWLCLTLNQLIGLLDRPTEWALILTAAGLFLHSLIQQWKERGQPEGEGQGIAFLELSWYAFHRLRGVKNPPIPERRKWHQFHFAAMRWVFLPITFQLTYMAATWFIEELGTIVHLPPYTSLKFWFNQVLFPLSLCLVFFIDFLWSSLSYLLQTPGNQLRSVSHPGGGWVLALISLFPLYSLLEGISPLRDSALAQFEGNMLATSLVRLAIWACLNLYLWSMLSLGIRKTHLSHQGVVVSGAYRWVRHPGYAALLGIGWLSLLPLMLENPLWTLPMMGWTVLLMERAQREENLLLSDPLYRDYRHKVRYRFLPYLY